MTAQILDTDPTTYPPPAAPAMSGSGATDAVPSATAGQFGSIEHGNDTSVTLDDKDADGAWEFGGCHGRRAWRGSMASSIGHPCDPRYDG